MSLFSYYFNNNIIPFFSFINEIYNNIIIIVGFINEMLISIYKRKLFYKYEDFKIFSIRRGAKYFFNIDKAIMILLP